jgi:predicted transcriptional regulator
MQSKQQADWQAQSDLVQAKKLQTVANNVQSVHSMAAIVQQQHADIEGVVDNNTAFLKDLHEYDTQNPNSKLVLKEGVTFKEAMDSPQWGQGKLTSNNLVMSGHRDVYDPETKKTTTEATYSIVDPSGRVSLSPEAIKILSTINPQFQAAADGNLGDLKLGVGQYLAAMHQVNTTHVVNSFAKRADEALGVSNKFDLAAAVRDNKGGSLMPAINAAENAISQGGDIASVLSRVQQSPGSSVIFEAMNLSQDKVSQYIKDSANKDAADKVRATADVKEEAKGITSDAQANQILSNPNSTPDQRVQATSFLSLQAKQKATETRGEAQARTTAESEGKAAQEQPQIESSAKSLAAGDLTALSDITSMRSDMRTKVYARAKELNPNFNTGDIKIKMGTQDEFTKGKAGDQIQSFSTFLGHAGEAAQASANYRRLGSPLLNNPLNWIEKNAANDTDYQTFITALQPVRGEYMTFLQNNHALTESDKKAGATIMSDDSTPAQVEGALKQMGKTAFIRLDSLNSRYKRVMHTDFPDMLNDDAREGANILGLGAQAGRFQTGGSVTGGAGGPVAGKTGSTQTPVGSDPFAQFGGKVRENVNQ